MALSTESVKARLTQKFYQDIQSSLKPLVQANSFAVKLDVRIDPKFGEKLQKAADKQIRAFGDTPDLPGLVLQAHTDTLSDLVGLNTKDEDLIPFVTKVDVTITVDKSLKGPPARVIQDVVKSAINPLKQKRKDVIKVVYEDLAVLYPRADRPRSNYGNQPQTNVPVPVSTVDVLSGKISEKKELTTEMLKPTQPEVLHTGFPKAIEMTLSSPLLTGLVVLGGFTGLLLTFMKKTKSLRDKTEASLEAFSKFPTTLAESARSMSSAISGLKTPPTPAISSVKVELVGAGGKSMAPRAVQKIVQGPKAKEVPNNESIYYGEKQVLGKIQKLFEKPETLATILSSYLADGKKIIEIVRFLKILTPEQIKQLSKKLSSEELEKMLKLSSGAHRSKIDFEKMGQFIDKMMSEFTARVIEDAANQKSNDVLLDLSTEELGELISKSNADLRACVVSLIPEQDRSVYFQSLNLSKVEKDEIMIRLVKDTPNLFTKVALDLLLATANFHYKNGRIDALLKLHELARQKLNAQDLKKFSITLETWLGSSDSSHVKLL